MSTGTRERAFTVELDAPLATKVLGSIARGNSRADALVITLMDAGAPAALSGYSASGVMLNALGLQVPIEASISGNVVTAVLGEGCYDVAGSAAGFVNIQNADASIIRSVIRFTADVIGGGDGGTYDPDAVIGSLDELLARLAAMETATADGIAAAKEARSAGAQAVESAQTAGAQAIASAAAAGQEAKDTASAAGQEAKDTANAAAADAAAAAQTARETIYTRALAILDDSPLAASHSLHAQRDYPLNVTVNGYTYQEGEGDPSPDNVRPIHGLDAAQVRAGGKNLLLTNSVYKNIGGILCEGDGNGVLKYSGTRDTSGYAFDVNLVAPLVILPGLKFVCDTTSGSGPHSFVFYREDGTPIALSYQSGGSFAVYDLSEYAYQKIVRMSDWVHGSVEYNQTTKIMLTYSDDATFEPYNAAVINPPLLPDGKPLMEGDTVENWVKSGCDIGRWLDGSEDEEFVLVGSVPGGTRFFYRCVPYCQQNSVCYSSQLPYGTGRAPSVTIAQNNDMSIYYPNVATVDELRAALASNPLFVAYRSIDYTPDKDLRVCKAERTKAQYILNGDNTYNVLDVSGNVCFTTAAKHAKGNVIGMKCTHFTPRFEATPGSIYISGTSANVMYIYPNTGITTVDAFKAYLAEQDAAGTPVIVTYELATPEVYMTDPLPLLPPETLDSDTVTVSASGETEVEYAHETKHYIDSKVSELVTLALANQ